MLWIRIRIASGFNGVLGPGSGFAIRIQEVKNDPEKLKKVNIFMTLSVGCSFLRAEGFSCSLDVLYGGLSISKMRVFNQYFFNFWSSKPWIGSGWSEFGSTTLQSISWDFKKYSYLERKTFKTIRKHPVCLLASYPLCFCVCRTLCKFYKYFPGETKGRNPHQMLPCLLLWLSSDQVRELF